MDDLRSRRRAYWQRRRLREGMQAKRDLDELKATIRAEIEAVKEEDDDGWGCVIMALIFLCILLALT